MTEIRFPRGARGPIRGRATSAKPVPSLPFWLKPSTRPRVVKIAPTPREARWWVGVALLTFSVTLLSFAAHVGLFSALQESQSQAQNYSAIRSTLANATTPVGPLDVDNHLVASGTPVALISIPRLGVQRMVIVQGTSPDDLRSGPGHRRDTVMPGQEGTSVVMGRSSTYGAPFRDLSALVPGDHILVTTGQGVSDFRVTDIRRPGDRLPVALTGRQSRLQLVTGGAILSPDQTVYVDATRTRAGLQAVAPVVAHAGLPVGEDTMQNDPSALLPFLFALQWLAIAAGLCAYLFRRWGRWQTWILGLPVLLILGALTADAAASFLPNVV